MKIFTFLFFLNWFWEFVPTAITWILILADLHLYRDLSHHIYQYAVFSFRVMKAFPGWVWLLELLLSVPVSSEWDMMSNSDLFDLWESVCGGMGWQQTEEAFVVVKLCLRSCLESIHHGLFCVCCVMNVWLVKLWLRREAEGTRRHISVTGTYFTTSSATHSFIQLSQAQLTCSSLNINNMIHCRSVPGNSFHLWCHR